MQLISYCKNLFNKIFGIINKGYGFKIFMKILILLKKWPGGVGGGIKNISKELKKMGHVPVAISREEDLKITSFLRSIFLLRKKIIELDKKEKFDIIYTQDWSAAFPLIFPYPVFKKKHFCMFHGNQFGLGKILQKIVGKIMGKRLLCMAPSIKRKFPNANINYCGVNLSQFRSLNKKRRYLGWIQKETEKISKEEMEEISKKVNIPLKIAKGFSHEEMNSKFYNECKVFISLPPKAAGFQASWLEAMAAGVPVIIGNNEGAGEVQPFDKVYEENNPKEIVEIIKHPKKINYRKWITENDFTWKRHAKKLIEIFKGKD